MCNSCCRCSLGAGARSCGACSRHASSLGYLAVVVLSTVLAGVLKYAVAPALVLAASDPASATGAMLEAGAADLFYAVSDCVGRVEAWNYTFVGAGSNASSTGSLTAAAGGGVVFQQNLQTEVTQLGLCVGNFFVMRVSFALCVFYAVMALATWCAPLFHNGQWASKGFLYALALAGVFFVPNAFFYGYAHVARGMSFLFILLQMVILVDFAFDWQEDFQQKMEYFDGGVGPALAGGGDDDEVNTAGTVCCIPAKSLGCVQVGYVVISVALVIGAIVGSVLLYVFYQGCDSNIAIVTLTLLFGLILVVTGPMACASPQGEDRSIGVLVPAVVFNTCVYYAFSSVRNNPDGDCNPSKASANPDAGTVVLGLCVSALSLAWVTLRTAQNARGVLATTAEARNETAPAAASETTTKKTKKKKKKKKKQQKTSATATSNELEGPVSSSSSEEEDDMEGGGGGVASVEIEADTAADSAAPVTADERATQNKQIWLFHVIMLFGAFYLAMILTQWGDYTGLTADENIANQYTSLWVNAAGGWVAYLLFTWIRVAPICCPSREFSDVRDGF
jgi:hypothetical protein